MLLNIAIYQTLCSFSLPAPWSYAIGLVCPIHHPCNLKFRNDLICLSYPGLMGVFDWNSSLTGKRRKLC